MNIRFSSKFVALLIVCGVAIACEKTPEEARKELISLGVEIDQETFADSAATGNERIVDLFITANQPLNPTDVRDDEIPLVAATEAGKNEVVRMLLNAGADPGIEGAKPLRVAAAEGNRKAVNYFLEGGIKSNDDLFEGAIAAIHGGNPKMSALLVGNTDSLDSYYIDEILSSVAREGGTGVIRSMEKKGYIDALDDNRIVEFKNESLRNRNTENVLYVSDNLEYDRGPDWSIVTLAVKHTSIKDVRKIVERGYEVNPKRPDISGTAPIAIAAREGKDRIVEFLLQEGANPNYHIRMIDNRIENSYTSYISRDVVRNSAPLMSICNSRWEIVDELLKNSAKFEILARVIRVEKYSDFEIDKSYIGENIANECRREVTGSYGRKKVEKVFKSRSTINDEKLKEIKGVSQLDKTAVPTEETWAARNIRDFKYLHDEEKEYGFYKVKKTAHNRYGMIVDTDESLKAIGRISSLSERYGEVLVLTGRNNIFFAPSDKFTLMMVENVR